MLQAADPFGETADSSSELAALREALAAGRRERALLRDELTRVRADNQRLRSKLHALSAPAVTEAGACVHHEMTAGTSIGPRRHTVRPTR